MKREAEAVDAASHSAKTQGPHLVPRPQLLYLQAALDAHQEPAFGTPSRARQPGWRWLCGMALFMLAAIAALGVFGEFTRKETVTGFLAPEAGVAKVHAPQAGVVIERRVSEGQAVRKGQVLLVLGTDRLSAGASATQATVLDALRRRRDSLAIERQRQQAIDRLAVDVLQEKQRGLRAQRDQVERQRRVQAQRASNADRMVAQYETLRRDHYVSESMLQVKLDEALQVQRDSASVERTLAELRQEQRVAALEQASADLKRTSATAQIERQLDEVDQQLAEAESRRALAVVAPVDGTVSALLVDVGQVSDPATPLLSILPASTTLVAHLLLPTRAAGFAAVGQAVALRVQAFPYQRFGQQTGQVIEVGSSAVAPGETAWTAPAREPVYLVKVRLDAQSVQAYGTSRPLRPGMTLDADLKLERRRLIDWIFDPLRAVTGRW